MKATVANKDKHLYSIVPFEYKAKSPMTSPPKIKTTIKTEAIRKIEELKEEEERPSLTIKKKGKILINNFLFGIT